MREIPQLFQARIKEAKEKGLKELDLTSYAFINDEDKLKKIPAEVFELTQLESLDLSYNNIIEISQNITILQNLKSLNLLGNKFRDFPSVLGNLPNLVILRLSLSSLQLVPKWLYQIQELSLDLSNNQLKNLPECLTSISNLTHLNLSRNQLKNLPNFITNLMNLTYLDLSFNKLTNLPKSINQLSKLTRLNLTFNELKNLPESISQLSNLICLDMSFNQFEKLPESISQLSNLTILILSENRLKKLPESICNLSRLTLLDFSSNPLETPPLEIANRGIEAIKEYFQQLKQDSDYLYEAKLLIVGEAGAGKTTLAKKIQDPDYQLQEEKSTEGIDVITEYFPYNNQRDFRMNIWDFGGQEIYHATHQFFLTKRSLYALVVDTRKEDTDFYYWLNLVELLSDNSPLLIIKNEKQDREREINERGLRGQFINLEKTLATNLKTNRGLTEILTQIQHYITNLPHVGQVLPRTWKQVREVLEQDPRDYISLEEYLQICETNGITKRSYKLQLSGYLHDLGVFLHFQDDPLLNKTVILKPEWGTKAVYKVLDNKTVRNNWGKFIKQDLAKIWYEEEYEHSRDELLQLMIKFKLCYEIPGKKNIYIAPQLLTENQLTYPWDENNNLIFRYTYEFMPKGILTQFIVAMHRYIWQQEYVWKSGVILEKEETFAEVIEYYGKREITIRVAGQQKRDFLTTITYELDKIHDSYNQRLKYKKWIPCNCQHCQNNQNPHSYPFETLQKFVAAGKDKIQCRESFAMVNVLSLIDDTIDYGKLIQGDRLDSSPIYRQQNKELIELAKILANNRNIHIEAVGSKPMSEIQITGSKNTLIGVGDGNHQTGDVTVTNNIGQQDDYQNSQEVEQLLNQLQEAINCSPDLNEKQKAKALKQVKTLTTAVGNPTDEEMEDKAEGAIAILSNNIVAKLPHTAAFVTICKEILPRIGHFFGLD